MTYYVYLIQNGDLYNIGYTNNLERTRVELKPGELLASLKTDNPNDVIRSLKKMYIDNRIPGSDYYRLGQSQVNQCRLILEKGGGNNYFQPILKGGKLFAFFIVAWFFITFLIIQFGIDPILNRFN